MMSSDWTPVEWSGDGLVDGSSCAGARNGLLEPVDIHRLQQIVHRVDFKGFDRPPIEGRDENHSGSVAVLQEPAGDFEPGQSRHLHIEEGDIRRHARDLVERLDAISGLCNDVDAVHLFQ
jgi:hypothetical protein